MSMTHWTRRVLFVLSCATFCILFSSLESAAKRKAQTCRKGYRVCVLSCNLRGVKLHQRCAKLGQSKKRRRCQHKLRRHGKFCIPRCFNRHCRARRARRKATRKRRAMLIRKGK